MSAIEEIERLKSQFVSLNTEEELNEFDKKMWNVWNSKTEREQDEFAKAFEESANRSLVHAEQVCDVVGVRLKLI